MSSKPANRRFSTKKRLIIGAFGVIALILLVGFYPHSRNVTLPNGGRAHVRAASLFRSFFNEANCEIEYQPPSGQRGSIVLWQSFFDGPMFVIPSANTNILLCVYDYDVELRLFKIDTSKPFSPPASDDDIKHILFTSSWDIRFGMNSDWQEILSYLRTVSPKEFKRNLLPSSFRFAKADPQDIIGVLKYQHVQ